MKKMNIQHLMTCGCMALLLAAVMTLGGCKSSRSASKSDKDNTTTESVTRGNAGKDDAATDNAEKETSKSAEYLSSKMGLTIPYKDAVFTVDGTMKMKSGEMIQVSMLMPILRTEIARVQVTPTELLIVDRVNRRFVRAGDSELKYAVVQGFTYDKLEKILFALGKAGTSKSLSGADLGLTKLKKAKVELYDFSTEPVDVSPIELSSRYKQVTLEEMMQLLTSLSL